jgi:hypothetical protein
MDKLVICFDESVCDMNNGDCDTCPYYHEGDDEWDMKRRGKSSAKEVKQLWLELYEESENKVSK